MAVELDTLEGLEKALQGIENLEPLTNWSNEPEVSDLKADLEEAQPYHDQQISKIQTWIDNLRVEGKAKPKKRKGRSSFQPKLIRKQAEWRYAALSEPFLADDDLFKTEPVSWEDKEAAYQNGLVLNNQFNTQINKVAFIDQYVRAAVDEGTVIVRTGWDFEEEEVEVEVPVMKLVPVQDPQQVQAMLAQNIAPVEQVPTGEVRIERQMRTKKNQPSLVVCDSENVIVDPSCGGDVERAEFIIYKFETSKSELEKKGLYSNLDLINIQQNSRELDSDSSGDDNSFNFKDEPRKKFTAYEYWGYWDIDGSGITKPIVATWVGDVMIRLEENPFPKGFLPFTVVQYLPLRKETYGEPDGELLEENQKIIGAVTRGMIDIMGRSAAGQRGIRQDALDVTNMRRYEHGQDYYFNAHIDPRQAFYTHEFAQIPQSAEFMLAMQNQDAEALTGVKAFHGGISGEGLGNTATGVRTAMDAASKRELGILRRLSRGIIDIGRKIMAMNAVFLSDEEVVRVTNEEFVTVRRDQLDGKFDIRLHISTAETDNMKAQELAFMLQTMGNSMPFDMSQMILADIARLRKMPDLAKKIEEYQPQPDPMEEQLKQLELQKLQMEVRKLASEAMENEAEAQLDLAKARETSNKADMLDLDFVEQESGVKQERDIEKQQAQSEGNIRMKALDRAMQGRIDLAKETIKSRNQGNSNQ